MLAPTRAVAVALMWLVGAAPAPSGDAKAAFARGERAMADGKLDQAATAYKEALAQAPTYAAALNGLGLAYFKQDKKKEAIQQFRAATAADPGFALAWSNLGFAARKAGDARTAVAAYEQYVALQPQDPDGAYGLAESYRMAGDRAKAIVAYDQYIEQEVRPSEQKWVQKAREQAAALRASTKAAPKGTTASAAGPDAGVAARPAPSAEPVAVPAPAVAAALSDAGVTSAPTLDASNEPPLAIPAPASPAVALCKQRIADGDQLMKTQRYREAAFAYLDATNADATNTEALFKLARSYATLGYLQQAIDKWTQVLQLTQDPQIRKGAQDNIGKAQARIAEAGGSSPQARGEPPGAGPIADGTRDAARQHYERGVAQITAKDFGSALSSLTQTIQLEPTLAIAYVARGSANIGLLRYPQAVADYQYALKLDPQMGAPMYGLAEAYRGMGRPLEARQWYERFLAAPSADAREELKAEAKRKLEKL